MNQLRRLEVIATRNDNARIEAMDPAGRRWRTPGAATRAIDRISESSPTMPLCYAWLDDHLTEAAVAEFLRPLGIGTVKRYRAPESACVQFRDRSRLGRRREPFAPARHARQGAGRGTAGAEDSRAGQMVTVSSGGSQANEHETRQSATIAGRSRFSLSNRPDATQCTFARARGAICAMPSTR